MQKKTSLYIPTPCHKDWNKMSPTQQGKFCSSCSKQVVDFSLMSDNQILNFLSNQSGKLCGRFDAEQLRRPLIETKIKKRKSCWMALTMPLLVLFKRTEAQQNVKLTGDTIYSMLPSKENINEQLVGKIAICEPSKQITITGKVVDESNIVVPFVNVIQKGTHNAVAANSEGQFSINVDGNKKITLIVSGVGFNTQEQAINLDNAKGNIQIILHASRALSGDVVVVRMGYTIQHYPTKPIDTIKTTIKKICRISAFKIYPNPAIKGNSIQLQVKQSGIYQMQLLDNQSNLIKAEEINIETEKSTTSVIIPSNLAKGTYYLRLINEQTKKSYTEKLIIQ